MHASRQCARSLARARERSGAHDIWACLGVQGKVVLALCRLGDEFEGDNVAGGLQFRIFVRNEANDYAR